MQYWEVWSTPTDSRRSVRHADARNPGCTRCRPRPRSRNTIPSVRRAPAIYVSFVTFHSRGNAASPSLSRFWCSRNGRGSSALLASVQSGYQVRLSPAQAELLRQLAGIGAAPGRVDRLLEGLRRASKLDLVHAIGHARIFVFDALDPAPRLHADRGREFQFASHRRQARFESEAAGAPAVQRANCEKPRNQACESERGAGDAEECIEIHVMHTRR